ncbi:MAG: hypothetical protein E7551_01180 [Ruminococcaceae bacterium]|nr:hypothetical protein [Oscillospiraceae bacterium]
MNKYLLKALYFVLVLAIAVSALGACSEKEDTVNSSSDVSSEVSSNEDVSEVEDTDEASSEEDTTEEDVWYDDLEDTEADDEFEYDDMLTASLNIYNSKAVQDDFMGFGGVYHAFPFRTDDIYGRNYTEKMANAEIKRVINSGITMARTFYSIDDSWDSKAKAFNWESDQMQAIYKYCLALKEGGVEVLINHWYCSSFLFTTYPWGSDGNKVEKPGQQNECHESIRVPGDQQATIENFAEFMAETVRQLRAHGCTNATTISIATEPYATWKEEWADIVSNDEIKNAASKDIAQTINAVSANFKKAGIRKYIKIMGPNFAGGTDATLYYKYFKKHIDPDACDLVSLHNYYGNDLTKDNYDLWKTCAEDYKTEVGSFSNFVWDEYNCSPKAEESIESRHSAYNGVQLALAQVCFMNYGMKSSFIWSLLDQQWPNNSSTSLDSFKDGVHMCGVAPTFLQSSIVFPPYYSFSLAANIVGEKGSKLYRGDDDTYEGVYAAMAENKDGELSILVVNTNITETATELKFEKSLKGKTFYRHVYNVNDITCTAEGELIAPDLKLTNATTVLRDVIEPYSVVVYTTKKVLQK